MNDPQYPVNLIAGQWNLVATSVTTGLIHKKTDCNYLQTFRLTGGTAPTLISEGVLLFNLDDVAEISATEPIDVYIWVSKDAIIRVDV